MKFRNAWPYRASTRRKKITMYQKIKVLTLLQASFTYKKIRDQFGVSNDCIINVPKKEE